MQLSDRLVESESDFVNDNENSSDDSFNPRHCYHYYTTSALYRPCLLLTSDPLYIQSYYP